jgi:protein TonB
MKGVVAMALLVSLFLVLTSFIKSPTAHVEGNKRKRGDDVMIFETDIKVIPEERSTVVRRKISPDRVPVRVVTTEVIEVPEPPTEEPAEVSGGSDTGSETGLASGVDGGTGGENGPGEGTMAPPPTPTVFLVVEEMPHFDGGMAELHRYLQRKMRYPASARRLEIEGTVYVSFVIGSSGEIRDVQVVKGIFKDCDQEAKRVIESMPKWVPGRQQKVPVSVKMVLPIKFALAKS